MSTEPSGRRHGGLVWAAAAVALLTVACRQDMHDQAKLDPLEASDFFRDGRASRVPPAFTVARGHLAEDRLLHTGIGSGGEFASELPVELDRELLDRGRERYEIYCTPCHDWTGSGRGMIVQRGFKQPPSYHEERLRGMPVGYFFNVASNGYGLMSGYSAQISVEDRWAIAAWVRVLQRSQWSPTGSLPDVDRQALESAAEAGSAAGAL